jgi:hypothetical protein
MSTEPRIACTAAPFTDRPAKAPFRSTTWIQAQPESCQARAWAAGSAEYTVAWSIAPRRSRTQAPSLRSIAG